MQKSKKKFYINSTVLQLLVAQEDTDIDKFVATSK